MKKIVALPIWYNGELQNAVWLNVFINAIDLGNSASIIFNLYNQILVSDKEEIGDRLQTGSLLMKGEDYTAWGNDDEYVWQWVASKINVTIINEENI